MLNDQNGKLELCLGQQVRVRCKNGILIEGILTSVENGELLLVEDKEIGLLSIPDGKKFGFIGKRICKNPAGKWRLSSVDAFCPPLCAKRFAYDNNQIYAVRYARSTGPVDVGKAPQAVEVLPLKDLYGNNLCFPKTGISEAQIVIGSAFFPKRGVINYSIPFDRGTVVVTTTVSSKSSFFDASEGKQEQMSEPSESSSSGTTRDKHEYNPRFVLENMVGVPVFVTLNNGERICGLLEGFDSDKLNITTHYDKDGKQILFTDVREMHYYGYITKITNRNGVINGGVIDKLIAFQSSDLRRERDRNQFQLQEGKAVAFRILESSTAQGYEADDIIPMREVKEFYYAFSGSEENDRECRFGEDPCTLVGHECNKVYLPKNVKWEPNSVFEFCHFKASCAEFGEVEWLDRCVRFDSIENSHLYISLLDPLPAGYDYAIARRTLDDKVTIYLAYYNPKYVPNNMMESIHSRRIPIGDLGIVRGRETFVNNFYNTKKSNRSKNQYLIRFKPDKKGNIEPGSVEILKQISGVQLLEGLHIRNGQEQSLLLYLKKRKEQSNDSLLKWAFSAIDLPYSFRVNNIDSIRQRLDKSKLSVTEKAKGRFEVWSISDNQEDLRKLKEILPAALTALGASRGQRKSSVQQAQALFLYMLALRVDPGFLDAWTHFMASLAYQQDPKTFSSLSACKNLHDVTEAIAAAKVSDEVFDALINGTMMLFVSMSFNISKNESDVFEQLKDPMAHLNMRDIFLRGADNQFLERYQARLRTLLGESSGSQLRELIRKAADQCDAFSRQSIDSNYTGARYGEGLKKQLSDPRSSLLTSGRSELDNQILSLLDSMNRFAEYNIFPLRKAYYDVMMEEYKAMESLRAQYRFTFLYRYLYAPHIEKIMSYSVRSAGKKFYENTVPKLSILGCDVIGYQEECDLLHLRVSIGSEKAGPSLQPAQSVSLSFRRSADYDILEEDCLAKNNTPPTERATKDEGTPEITRIDLANPIYPAVRKELGIGFLLHPRNSDAASWKLIVRLNYGMEWIRDNPIAEDEIVLEIHRPQVVVPPDKLKAKLRVGMFQKGISIDSQIETYIKAQQLKTDDPRKLLLEKIRKNRDDDVEKVITGLRNPALPETFSLVDDTRLVVLQGQWRVGKSTVLKRIARRIRDIDTGAVVVEMELPNVDSTKKDPYCSSSGRAFVNTFLGEFQRACRNIGLNPIDSSGAVTMKPVELWECRRQLLDWKQKNPKPRIVLLLDEFTRLYADMRKGCADRNDLQELISFLASDELKLLTVAVGGEFTSRMVQELDGNTRQKKLSEPVTLQYLAREQVRDFVQFVIGLERCPDDSESFEAAVDRLYKLTRGQMFLLYKFCDRLLETAAKDPSDKFILTNRWIDQTIRSVANHMTKDDEDTWFDFLWNPFNEAKEKIEHTAVEGSDDTGTTDETVSNDASLLPDDRVRDDYKTIFNSILIIADRDTHTFQREELEKALTKGDSPIMTSEVFNERFEQLVGVRKVLEPAIPNVKECYRIAVDLCFCLLYPSRH